MFKLDHPTGYTLTIGFGSELGVAQYAASNGDPPYLVTVAGSPGRRPSGYPFWVGNELTEIPLRFCLPIGLIEGAASEFAKTGKRSATVNWETL